MNIYSWKHLPTFTVCRRALICIIFSFTVFSTGYAAEYQVSEIGTLGGTTTTLKALNEADQIVGHSQTSSGIYHVFIYQNSVMTDLGTPEILGTGSSFAYDINDQGHVIGYANLPPENLQRYFLYDGDTVHNLSEIINYQISTVTGNGLTAINNQGVITAVRDGLFKEAYVLTPDGNGGYTLENFGYADQHNWAMGLNNSNQVFGMTRPDFDTFNDNIGTIYDNGSLYQIGTLGGVMSLPYDINQAGNVVGYSDNGARNHAFLYDGNSMIDLDNLNGPWSSAYGLNDIGDIVGSFYTLDYLLHAFIHQGNGMVDLNSLIDPASGWVLENAMDINNNGLIIGTGKLNGVTKPFLLTPVNDPPIANAGGPYNGTATVAVQFDGSGSSDPENKPLSFQWDFGDGATGTGENPTHSYSSSGNYTVTLVVNDGVQDSIMDSTNVTIDNHLPNADAGNDFDAFERDTVYLDGNGSFDLDGSIVSYAWTQISGKSVTLENALQPVANFRVSNVKTDEQLVFELKVIDNEGGTSTDQVVVTILNK